MSVPGLEIVDRIDLASPETGKRAYEKDGLFTIDATTGAATYYSATHVVVDRPGFKPGASLTPESMQNIPGPHRYLLAVDLGNKKQRNYTIFDGDPAPHSMEHIYSRLFASADDVGYITNEPINSEFQSHQLAGGTVLYLLSSNRGNRLKAVPISNGTLGLLANGKRLAVEKGDQADTVRMCKVSTTAEAKAPCATIESYLTASLSPNGSHLITILNRFRLTSEDQEIAKRENGEVLIYLGIWRPGGRGPHSGVAMYRLH
jgi:hypothetical protein